jgi:hypothetical protein
MWTGAMLINSVWIVLAVLAWLRDEERKARRLDAMAADQAGRNGQVRA